MTRRTLTPALPLALALLCASAQGFRAAPLQAPQGYHVSTAGSDANSGTSSKPFRTIAKAVETAEPGDSILVHAGVYREVVVIRKSGRADERIRLLAAGDGEAVLKPSLKARSCDESTPTRDRAIQILDGNDYWTIRGLTIVGGILVSGSNTSSLDDYIRDRKLPGRGVYDPVAAGTLLEKLGSDGADYIRIAENKITGRGILTNAARYGRVRANEIFDIECGTGSGVWLSRFSDGWVVRDNYVHDIPASEHHPMSEGIRQGSSSDYNMIQNNLVENLGIEGGGDGVKQGRGVTSDTFSSWNVMRYNTVRRADQGLNEQSAGWGNQWLNNRTESIRRYGMNISGSDGQKTEPDDRVPAMVVVRCTVASSSGIADLSIGAVQEATFTTNAFPLVDLNPRLESYWKEVGNTWDGSSIPPPERPPQKFCGGAGSAMMPTSASRPDAGE